jgi:tryptophan halogenase
MKKVLIVGGGSAGWMTASYLDAQTDYEVTLLESDRVAPIGIGGSTTPYLKRFFEDIGIYDESEWMPQCNATYKLGVLYDDFDRIGSRWWNSFEVDEGKYPYWNKMRKEEGLDSKDFFKSCIYSAHIGMDDTGKINKTKDGKDAYSYMPTRSYGGHPEAKAWNLDTGAFGEFLKKRTADRVNHIYATIKTINTDPVEGITSLIDSDGNEHTADLYIDCTGFKSLLIDEVSDEGRIPLDPYLSHDKALVMPIEYEDAHEEMRPRTGAKAMKAGWMWNIPLYHQMVNGYVYTSKYITDEEAEAEMRKAVGEERVKDVETYIIDINTGHFAKPWTKNVIAIGMSAGFIEPMEATLIMVVQHLLHNLNQVRKGKMTKDEFNGVFEATLFDTLDFLSTQYYMSHRDDSEFWKAKAHNDSQITDRMKEWLETTKKALLPPKDDVLFLTNCWIAKLVGFEKFPEGDGFTDSEPRTLPTYSGTNFEPRNIFKYKEMDELNARIQMDKIRNFDADVLISQKAYLDKFIYI